MKIVLFSSFLIIFLCMPVYSQNVQADNNNFINSVLNGDIEVAESIFENGIDIDAVGKNDRTALEIAVINNNVEMVRFLLSKGADINKKSAHHYFPLFGQIH